MTWSSWIFETWVDSPTVVFLDCFCCVTGSVKTRLTQINKEGTFRHWVVAHRRFDLRKESRQTSCLGHELEDVGATSRSCQIR